MNWNWQQPDWPNFNWDEARLHKAEAHFLHGAGEFAGAMKHLNPDDQKQLTIEAITGEAVTTSESKARSWIAPAFNPRSVGNSVSIPTGGASSPPNKASPK